MAVVDLRPRPLPATASFHAVDVGKLGTIVDGYRLEGGTEGRRSHLPFQTVQGANHAGGGVILDLDDQFLPGQTFRQDQKGRLRLLLSQDGVHFPMTDGRPGVHFLRPVFNAGSGGRPGALLVGAGVAALVLTVTGKVAHFKGQEDALPDIGIQGRLTDRRLELHSLDADFSKDRRRRIAVFHDPPFNVGRQFVVVADL